MGDSGQIAIEGLFELLGWRLSKTEEKRKPFETEFVSLGVQVDFSRAGTGIVLLKNKPGRVDGIKEQVNDLLSRSPAMLNLKEALSLRGKVAFAEGQTRCKLTAFVAMMLSEWASIKGARKITEELKFGLFLAIEHLRAA